MKADGRIFPLHCVCRGGDRPHNAALPASDIDVPGDSALRRAQFGFRFPVQLEQFFRPFFQKHPRFGQRDLSRAAHEQLFSDLLFQVLHLLGKARLSDVQKARRTRDALLPRYGEKITKFPQFHFSTSIAL